MAQKPKDIVYFYGIPAYGHTLSNLYLAGRLAEAGFTYDPDVNKFW